jgi:hypothetical protein
MPIPSTWQTLSRSGTTSAYVVGSVTGNHAVLTHINATSDLSTSRITFFDSGNQIAVTAASAAGQTALNAPGTGNFAGSDLVVIHKVDTDTYEVASVSSVTASTVVLSANLGTAVGVGDKVYKLTSAGSIALGAATVEKTTPIRAWDTNKPAVVRITGTSACAINSATFQFRPAV